jgi:hypothetical protein
MMYVIIVGVWLVGVCIWIGAVVVVIAIVIGIGTLACSHWLLLVLLLVCVAHDISK